MIAFAVGYDVVWWDGRLAHVVGDDIREIAAYMNSDEVVFEQTPRAAARHSCVLPQYTIGGVSDEFEFRSGLRIWGERHGDWVTPLEPGDGLWPQV